jgi:2-hydroxy-3-keto-5-methylthiopentenyl-1-phosphate phosphatase
MCKTRVIRRFPEDTHFRMLIGDSVTDFEGAKLADLVFARSHLATRCRELDLPHHEYDTFFDVIDVLRALTTERN